MKKIYQTSILLFVGTCLSLSTFSQANIKSLKFDGVDDNVVIPHNSAYNNLTQLSLSSWVKFNKIPDWKRKNGGIGILTKAEHNTTGANSSFYLFTEFDENHLRFDIKFDDGTFFPLSYDLFWNTIDTSQWYNITGVYDGNKSRLYINGDLVHTTANSHSGNILNSTVPLEISGDFGTLDPLNGYISSTSLWSVAINQNDIKKYMCDLPTGKESGLIGLWNMEVGTGITVGDSSSIKNNGTLYQGVTWSNLIPTCDSCTKYTTVYDTITYIDTIKHFDTIITRYAVTDTLIIDIPLGFIQSPNLGQLKMYPNPTNDFVIIENDNPNNLKLYSIEIINSSGAMVYNSKLSRGNLQIPVSNFGSKGIFQVMIKDNSGVILDSRKLIIN